MNECDSNTLFSTIEDVKQERFAPPQHNPTIPVSFFQDLSDTGDDPGFDDRNEPIRWWTFACMLARASRQEHAIKESAWLFSPTVYNKKRQYKPDGEPYEGWRNHLNATTSALISIDFDGDFEFKFVHDWLVSAGVESLIYTTASHKLDDQRFRVLIPLSEPVDPDMHVLTLDAIVNLIKPGHRLKDSTKRAAHSMFYFPGQYATADENKFEYLQGGILSAANWFDLGGVTMETPPPRAVAAYTAPLSRDVAWDYNEPVERYMALSSGRHSAFFGMLVSIGMKALHAGYDLDEHELAEIAREVHQQNPPSKSPYKDFHEAARRALEHARCQVVTPAYEVREEYWARWLDEMQRMIDGSFYEPNWPSTWYDQAHETVREIQELRRQADPKQSEPEPDSEDKPIYNFFGSLVPQPKLTPNMLPEKIAGFVWDEAERMGCDPAALALCCLIVCSGAITDAVKIAPMRRNDRFTVSARLWGKLLGPPGSKKSPAMAAALHPLEAVAAEWLKQDLAAMEEYHEKLAEYEAARRRSKDEDSDLPEKPEKPKMRILISNDFTMEGIAAALVDNERGVLLQADEGVEILCSFDAYRSNGAKKDRGAALALFDGRPRRIDRAKNADNPMFVANWGAGMLLGIQNDVLREKAPNFQADGMMQRFLMVAIESGDDGVDRYPDLDALADYNMLVRNLAYYNPLAHEPLLIRLSEEAQPYRERVERLARAIINSPGAVPALKGHAEKIRGIFGRLLLTLHMIDCCPYWHGINPNTGCDSKERLLLVNEQTAKQAFLLPHAVRIYEDFFRPDSHHESRDVQWAAGHILAHGLQTFSDREFQQKAPKPLRQDKKRRDHVMQLLTEANWLTSQSSKKWLVNPRVHTEFAKQAEYEREQREKHKQQFTSSRATLDDEYGDEE